MDPDELFTTVRKQPFEPFRLFVSDGTAYDVRHPDQILIGRRSCHVGLRGRGEGPFQRIAIVSNVHITRIEPINGAGSRRRPAAPK